MQACLLEEQYVSFQDTYDLRYFYFDKAVGRRFGQNAIRINWGRTGGEGYDSL